MKLSELRTADQVRADAMTDPAYRRAYRRGWLLNKAQIAWLRLRVKAGL